MSRAALVLASIAGWLGLLASAPAATASTGGLHVIPFPGTPDASPSTTIIFSSLRPSSIASVAVVASASGAHRGHLAALPDGAGTAFIPAKPFVAGEQVLVAASLRSSEAGAASGAPGATTLRFSFGVAESAGPRPASAASATRRASASRRTTSSATQHETMSFHSESFRPPIVTAGRDPDTTSGDIFLTAKHAAHFNVVFQGGPMILDPTGRLVWFRPVHGETNNLEVQRYQGQPVLTWWQTNALGGRGHKNTGRSQDVILDRSYRTVAVVRAGNGLTADSHEFQITPQGTALIDCQVRVRTNLTSVGGPSNGVAYDYVIQELDIKTGRVLWEWHALGHIPVNAAYIPYRTGRPFDFFHLNSIQQLPNHDLLVSARHTWGVYEIDKRTGKVIWTLGGKYSNFKFGPDASFEWQHDAHLTGHILSVFDDASNGAEQKEFQSSAKVLRLNFVAGKATLVQRYDHVPPIITPSQGSAQILPNGNMFVGWGGQPDFSEYRADGRQIFNASLAAGAQSYRAYRFPWSAQPQTPPAFASEPNPGGRVVLYASWNGATDVAGWQVLGGPNPNALTVLTGHTPMGFETELKVESEPPYFEVRALGSRGTVLSSSPIGADPSHVAIFAPSAFVDSGSGTGAVGVGCFTRQNCHMSVQISSGKSVLGGGARHVPLGTGALMSFTLSSAGRRALAGTRGKGMPVQVTAHDASGATATRTLTLIPYSIQGSGPPQSASQSPTVQLVQTTGFVSPSTGTGQILGACYAAIPCQVTTTVSANGISIASTAPEHLGIDELGELSFQLTGTGRAMLASAPGNQLPAQITLSNGADTTTGDIALVGYR